MAFSWRMETDGKSPVAKETKFEFWGFIFVMLAAVMSGFCWCMTQILLQVFPLPYLIIPAICLVEISNLYAEASLILLILFLLPNTLNPNLLYFELFPWLVDLHCSCKS